MCVIIVNKEGIDRQRAYTRIHYLEEIMQKNDIPSNWCLSNSAQKTIEESWGNL